MDFAIYRDPETTRSRLPAQRKKLTLDGTSPRYVLADSGGLDQFVRSRIDIDVEPRNHQHDTTHLSRLSSHPYLTSPR